MKVLVVIISLLAISMPVLIGASFASEYAFGTKVATFNSDVGRSLKNVPAGAVLGFWDVGSDQGAYDEGDVVYLDMPPIGIANANDIRLTPFSYLPAGSKVKSIDNDVNSPLTFLPMEMRFLNLYGSRLYDINDPVYAHQSSAFHLEYIVYTDANFQAYAPGSQGLISNIACTNDGFSDRLPFTGTCSNLPRGATCLTYSDNFRFVVSDDRLDCSPLVVGSWNIRPIEVIRCNDADYYHILGTQLVKIDPRQKTLFTQAVPGSPNTAAPLIAQIESVPDGGKAIAAGHDAVDGIGANPDLIRTYDIRLIALGDLAAGTKVLDFSLDLNKLVALPVLASFPKMPNDYGAIRFYDANGNGIYDFPDDVYLDISLPGSSSIGTVSVNDVRISGPVN